MDDQPRDISPPKIKKPYRLYALAAFLVFIILVAVVSVLTSSHHTTVHKTAQVLITNKGFVPATLDVEPGTTIIWINNDKSLHQIVSNPFPSGGDIPGLKSEILNNNQSYTYTAAKTGSFGYHDQLKPTINGTIVVRK